MQTIYQNKTWTISILQGNKEIFISNGNEGFFGYPFPSQNKIYYDRINFPKYIGKKAIQLVKKYKIQSIYEQ